MFAIVAQRHFLQYCMYARCYFNFSHFPWQQPNFILPVRIKQASLTALPVFIGACLDFTQLRPQCALGPACLLAAALGATMHHLE